MPTKAEKPARRKKSAKKWILILCIVVLAAAALVWLLPGANVVKTHTVEAGTQSVDASAFIRYDIGGPAMFVSDLSMIDLNQPGDYPVDVRFFGRTFSRVLQVQDTVSPTASVTDIVTMSDSMPAAEDFIADIQDITAVTVQYAAEPDMSREGDQTVSLLLTDTSGNTATVQAKLTVCFDHQAPVLEGVQPLQVYLGNTPDYLHGVTITDDIDPAPVLTVDDSRVDLNRAGNYDVHYNAADAFGNQAVVTTTVTVIEDTTGPVIYGVREITLFAGSTVAYRDGIALEDDTDANPRLTIDASGVDLSQPGTYELTYTATDAAGNETRLTTQVVVSEKPSNYVPEEEIYAKADAILAEIITEDMTNQQKAEAVYQWFNDHCFYANFTVTDKTDWLQVAYKMLDLQHGNCFGYYAASKLMFDRLGFPNLMVRRDNEPYGITNHYWNLVSLDGGQTWYHFDTTKSIAVVDYNRCLLTDAQLDYFNEHYFYNYYVRDSSLYPATPEEPLVEME